MKFYIFIGLLVALAGGAWTAAGESTNAVPLIAAGGYKGLLTGTSNAGLISGVLTMNLGSGGLFTAAMNLEGEHYHITGKLPASGLYTRTLHNSKGTDVMITLAYNGTPSVTGTITGGSEPVTYTGLRVEDSSGAGGEYEFIIGPGTLVESGSAPEGTGYGRMYVHARGDVSLTGKLPDGTRFATSSSIVSGSSIPVYVHMGALPNTGVAGTLVLQDVPNQSDCHGTLYWAVAPRTPSHYPAGFELATQFEAAARNRSIGGFAGDTVTFTATGADLQAPVTASIKLAETGDLEHGNANSVFLDIDRTRNTLGGNFVNPVTHERRSFRGVLLAKSRAGAGLFFGGGLSGTVEISY